MYDKLESIYKYTLGSIRYHIEYIEVCFFLARTNELKKFFGITKEIIKQSIETKKDNLIKAYNKENVIEV